MWDFIAGLLLNLREMKYPACTTWRNMAFLYTNLYVCPEGKEANIKIVKAADCRNGCLDSAGGMGVIYP